MYENSASVQRFSATPSSARQSATVHADETSHITATTVRHSSKECSTRLKVWLCLPTSEYAFRIDASLWLWQLGKP